MTKNLLAVTLLFSMLTIMLTTPKHDSKQQEPVQAVLHSTMIFPKITKEMRASCSPSQWKSNSRDLPVMGSTDRFTHSLKYQDCNGFDAVHALRLRVHNGSNCGSWIRYLGYSIYGYRLNPNVIGGWNPTTWSFRCDDDQAGDTYTTYRVHTTYVFASMSRDLRCLETAVTVDQRLSRKDQHTTIPSICLNGK